MISFFKSFGKGILYLITLPLTIIVLALFAVVGLFGFIYLSFKSIFLFFKGKTINTDLPEDIRAKEILNPSLNNEDEIKNASEETKSYDETVPFFYHPGVETMTTPPDSYKRGSTPVSSKDESSIEPEPMFTPIEDDDEKGIPNEEDLTLTREEVKKEEPAPFIPEEEPAPSFDPKLDDELDVIDVNKEDEVESNINEDGVDISLPKYDGGTNSMFSADEDDVEFSNPDSVRVDDLNRRGGR